MFSGRSEETAYRWTPEGILKVKLPDETPSPLSAASTLCTTPEETEDRNCYAVKRREQTRPTEESLLREMELQARRELGRPRTEYQPPRVEELDETLPDGDTIVVSQPTLDDPTQLDHLSDAEFQRLLPRLRPHLEKLNLRPQPDADTEDPGRERKPRYVLEKIRATEEYDLPAFKLGQHLKDTPITISMLQLL
ncbi:hypothetical protein N0V84_012434 [Fusarium piperis]|uniref:Uncharacterized protein n=1 Tax=Fusarium piperis TaxID=1435070 RepID=A0A9W8TA97_9HYPO|nr:hypothetical protein N0V84_012434 [Fusarium piperis]